MHIVVADDHRLIADALKLYLTKCRPDIDVSLAGNFEEAFDKVTGSKAVDLIVLDLNMPGMDGLDGLRTMRARVPDIPVVIISGSADPDCIREALDSGAAGYIPKDLSGKVMLGALDLVHSGGTYVPTMLVARASSEKHTPANGSDEQFESDNPISRLARREREVLSHLIQGHSNKRIARECGVTPNTAAFHVKGVKRKLGVSNRTEAAMAAVRSGWQV